MNKTKNRNLKGSDKVKEYQSLIGKIIIAIAIVIAGNLIAQAITGAGIEISQNIYQLGELTRDGLLQSGLAP
jgi:hypothetical protein